MQPNYSFSNARYKGPIESKKYNDDFNQIKYNLSLGSDDLNYRKDILINDLLSLIKENNNLKQQLKKLEFKYKHL